MTDARRIALEALTRITAEGRELDDALADAGIAQAEGRERGFAYTLVMHSLRWGRAADALLAQYIEKPIPERKHRAHWALRMGVVQLLVLKVPAHAAVSTTVALLKKRKPDVAYAGMANAVLKKIAGDGCLDASAALPEWMRMRWERIYGAQTVAAMAAMLVEEPPLDITLQQAAGTAVPLAAPLPASPLQGEGMEIGRESLRLAPTDVTALAGYAEGMFWVQDVASTLPVQLLGEVAGLRVLDACAAPGGKTAQLCARGASVTSLDRSPARLRRLRENMQRLHFTPEVVEADIHDWQPAASFDAILLDAPCSASGTLRRHPELGWMRAESDIAKLAGVQAKLWARCWQWLKPGGRMVYSVCSIEPEEGEEQLAAFLKAHPEAELVPATLSETAAPREAMTPQGTLRTLPHHWAEKGGMDGFFAVCVRKR